MVKANPSTIILKGHGHTMFEGIVSNATITPGMLVMQHTDGTIRRQSADGLHAPAEVAVEYELDNGGATPTAGGIDTNYAVGDRIKYVSLVPGQEFYGLVAANAAAIVINDRLQSAGDGTLEKAVVASQGGTDPFAYVPAGVPVAIALEAVDNSSGGTTVRIKARVV